MSRAKAPTLTIEDARKIAADRFGVGGEVEILPSYIDQNFLFGGEWILKVANAYDDEGTLDLQNRVMATVSAAVPGLAPTVKPSVDGRSTERVEVDGTAHYVRMVSFLPGQTLARASQVTGATWEDLGRRLAELDRALAEFDHPAMRRWIRWDLAHAGWIVDCAHLLPDSASRRLVERIEVQFFADVTRNLDRLPQAMIYNDANDHNIVVANGPEGVRVAGFFDFGDVVWTARVFEPAVAAAYAALGEDEPLEAMGRVAAGYHRLLPLDDLELRALFPAACMRLAVSVVVSAQDARLEPDNAYIRVSEAPAWQALERLVRIEPAAAEAALRAACGLPADHGTPGAAGKGLPEAGEVERLRKRYVAPSLSLSYRRPLEIVRGRGQYLFDRQGRAYLDCVNNVCHVGHCHPRVVAAAQEQIARLNTNTRYLHSNLGRLAERLSGLLPEPLDVCFFVNSGSEANELALRLARTATGRRHMLAVEHGYHGHTSALIGLSSYKHAGPGGAGAPDWVHVVPCPDPYRGRHRGPDSGPSYARTVADALERARASGNEVAGMIAEPIVGCGGQVVPPAGYLRAAFDQVRAAGGLAIADEVQVGFGRVGSHWWGFEAQGAVPDIVTVGKPFGNGHPLAAVVTTREIAQAFDNGMEFFATFGGNPVSCAVGLAVLDVLVDEELRERAADVGEFLLDGLRQLARRHPVIGDVRGQGLYLGVELVRDRETREPDAGTLATTIEAMRATGLLLSSDGPDHNVLKFKPPMVFGRADAEIFLTAFDRALTEATPQS